MKSDKPTEDKLRNQYGDDLIDDLRRWETICDSSEPHFLLSRTDGVVLFSLVEFGSVEIEDAEHPYVKIECLFPNRLFQKPIMTELVSDICIECKKPWTVQADNVLHFEELQRRKPTKPPIDHGQGTDFHYLFKDEDEDVNDYDVTGGIPNFLNQCNQIK